jgi:hypothetical protein
MIVRSKSDSRPAAAAVELAVLLPFLVFTAVISTDWARLLYHTITVESCARNGAMYAADGDMAARSGQADFGAAAMAECPSVIEGATSTTATSGSTTTITYALPSGEVVATIARTTTTDSTGAAAFVVNVEVPFKPITRFPGVPNTQAVARSVQMRVAPMLTRTP